MKWLLLGISIIFMGLRFFSLEFAPFINDEPQLQLLSQKAVQSNQIASLGLEGTRGVKYGPTAVWFYSVLRKISPDLKFQLVIFASLFLIAFLILTYLMYRTFGEEASLFFLALVSTSPLLTFYSRQLWDNTLQIFLWSVVLLLVFFINHQKKTALAMGILSIVLGLLFNLHLMCVASIGVTAIWVARKNLRWGLFAICSLTFLTVTFPYLLELFKMKHQASVGTSWPGQPLRVLYSALTQMSVFYSSHGARFLFEGSREEFRKSVGTFLSILFHWDMNFIFTFLVWVGSYRVFRSNEKDSFKGFIAILGPLCIFYYAIIGLSPLLPHYFGTLWFLTPFWLGYWLTQLKGQRLIALKTVLLVTVLINSTFVLASFGFIKNHQGTRGEKYGTVFPELIRTSETLCNISRKNGLSEISVDLHLVPGVLIPSLQYFISQIEGCEKVALSKPEDSTSRIRLEYKTEPKDSAALVVIDSGHPG